MIARRRRHAFALLLTVLLVGMLATVTAQLALLSGSESLIVARTANGLQHELAIDSMIAQLDVLLSESQLNPTAENDVTRLQLSTDLWAVVAELRKEARKTTIGSGDQMQVTQILQRVAAEHGLPADHLLARPIVTTDVTESWPRYVCFDQLINAVGVEEVFHWVEREPEEELSVQHTTWSDVLSLWSDRDRVALTATSYVDQDIRRWYLIVELTNGQAEVIHRVRL